MEGIKALRDAVFDLVTSRNGKSAKTPRQFVGQTGAAGAEEFVDLITGLPVDFSRWTPLQDPDTGEPYFTLGVDGLGNAPLGG
jgi:hypothetical protein